MPTPCAEPFPASFMGDCDQECNDAGHKGIAARKTWHGRFGFDRELGCKLTTATVPASDLTKYLVKTIDASVHSTAQVTVTKYTYGGPGICDDPTPDVVFIDDATFDDVRESTATVDRLSGVITITGCTATRSVTMESTNGIVSPNPPFFPDILCSGTTPFRLPWVDMLISLDACDGSIGTYAGGTCGQTYFPGGTPAAIETFFEDQSTDDGLGNVTTFVCTVALTATTIEFTLQYDYTTAGAGDDTCGNPYSYVGEGSGTAHVLITLSDGYTSTQCNDHVDGLLGQRALSDMTNYGWHYGCTYPLVLYDEVETPVSPEAFSPSATPSADMLTLDGTNCSWADPNATAGGNAGNGYTGALLNASGAVTHVLSTSSVFPDGAFKQYLPSSQLFAVKYAEILSPRPGHNFYRPCGDDRNLFSLLTVNIIGSESGAGGAVMFETDDPDDTVRTGDRIYFANVDVNTEVNGGDGRHWAVVRNTATKFTVPLTTFISADSQGSGTIMRFPAAWPICGHLDVSAATNATPIVVTTGGNYLYSSDRVDIVGVTGNTAANVTGGYVKPTGTTTFELYSDAALTTPVAGNAAYTGGGTVTNAASTSPPDEAWNTSASNGDYLVLFYYFDARLYYYNVQESNPIPGENQCYGKSVTQTDLVITEDAIAAGSPKVVCISPSGETFAAGVTYDFPAGALPLVLDEHYGSLWTGQVRQRMENPINMISGADYVEARISVPAGAPLIQEARGGSWLNNNPYHGSGINILLEARMDELDALFSGGVCPEPTNSPADAGNYADESQARVQMYGNVCESFDDDAGLH